AGNTAGGKGLPTDKTRIRSGQGRIGLACGASLVVGCDGQSRLGDRSGGSGLRERVIGGVGAAQAQTGHVNYFAGTRVLGGKGAGGTAGSQRYCVAAENARQSGTTCIKSSAGGSVINFVGGGDARDGQALSRDVGRSGGGGIGRVVGRIGA